MIPAKPSCAVALPRERNCATDAQSATEGATGTAAMPRKAASLQELRAQLRAQLPRNQSPAGNPGVPAQSCVVALSIGRNCATGKVSPHDTATGFDRERFEERAAIYEYDAGFPRPEAERLAYLEVTKHD